MYQRPKRIYNNVFDIENYLESVDVYNSKFLYLISNPNLEKSNYYIKTPYRPDIIAEDFYGNLKYEAFVILQLKCSISSLIKGVYIELINKSVLDDIIQNL